MEILLQLFPQPAFRNSALQCLSEVALAAPPLMSMTVWQGPVGIAALVVFVRFHVLWLAARHSCPGGCRVIRSAPLLEFPGRVHWPQQHGYSRV